MPLIRVTQIPNFKIRVECDSPDIFTSIKSNFSILTTSRFKIKPKDKEPYMAETTKFVDMFDTEEDGSIILRFGFLDFLAGYLSFLKKKGVNFDFEAKINKTKPITVSEKWKQILYENQHDSLIKLITFNVGTADLYTGVGKTEEILAIAESYLLDENLNGNVVILSPSNNLMKEIYTRAEKYNFSIPKKFNCKSRINILNPNGFINSSKVEDRKYINWLKNVKLVLIDESHHSAPSYFSMFDMMPVVERCYGFSASPDVEEGTEFKVGGNGSLGLEVKGANVVSITGPTRVRINPPIKVELVRVYAAISDPIITEKVDKDSVKQIIENENTEDFDSWVYLINHYTEHPTLSILLGKIIEMYDKKFYIPVLKTESGIKLWTSLCSQGIKSVFWSADTMRPENYSKEDDFTVVKKLIEEDYKVLISTTVAYEGINIPSLGALIPLIGKNFRMIAQPIGRSSRSKTVLIVLVYDTNNPVVLSQCGRRRRVIERTYKITSNFSFNFIDGVLIKA